MKKIYIGVLISLISITMYAQESYYTYTTKQPKIVDIEYKVRDIDYPDASYRRIYNDDYSLRLSGLPLKISGLFNDRAIYSHGGLYRGTAPYVIAFDVERYQDCAGTAMYIHAIASNHDITVHDANGKAYSISPCGKNNKEMGMCNSYSMVKYDLEKGLDIDSVMPGDLFAHGGYPGHIAVVLEVIIDKDGFKHMLIGQGWLPAVDFHIVYDKSPTDVWFSVEEMKERGYIEINTQHTYYDFKVSELMRWKDR